METNYGGGCGGGEPFLLLGPAYSEVGGIATHVEDDVTWTEIQEVLVILALLAALDGRDGPARGDVFGEDHLGVLIDSTFV